MNLPSARSATSGSSIGCEGLTLAFEFTGEGCPSGACEGVTAPLANVGVGVLPPSAADRLSGRLWGCPLGTDPDSFLMTSKLSLW